MGSRCGGKSDSVILDEAKNIVVSKEMIDPSPNTYENLVADLQKKALHDFVKREDDALEAVCPVWKHYRTT